MQNSKCCVPIHCVVPLLFVIQYNIETTFLGEELEIVGNVNTLAQARLIYLSLFKINKHRGARGRTSGVTSNLTNEQPNNSQESHKFNVCMLKGLCSVVKKSIPGQAHSTFFPPLAAPCLGIRVFTFLYHRSFRWFQHSNGRHITPASLQLRLLDLS